MEQRDWNLRTSRDGQDGMESPQVVLDGVLFDAEEPRETEYRERICQKNYRAHDDHEILQEGSPRLRVRIFQKNLIKDRPVRLFHLLPQKPRGMIYVRQPAVSWIHLSNSVVASQHILQPDFWALVAVPIANKTTKSCSIDE